MNEAPLILHILHHLQVGGMENGVVNLINHMPVDRYRHAIACIEDYSDFRSRIRTPDVKVLALHRSRIGVWGLRKKIYELCRDLRPSIVHSRNLSGLDALLPACLAGIVCVHGEHGREVGDLNGENNRLALLRRLHRPLVRSYITVSKDLQSYLINRVGVPPDRITQIYNGVDTTRFTPATTKPTGILPPHFIGPGKFVIGTVGRLQEVKDQATLIRAFAALLKQYPNRQIYLALVGEGPMRPHLEQLIAELNLKEVVCLTGAMDDVHEVLRCFDLFVLPSLGEGISNTILEAFASGVPVVATAVGGNVELVRPQLCGDLFAPQDTSTLTRILLSYINDESTRRAQSTAARDLAVADYSMEAMVNRYAEVYDRLRLNKQ